MSDDKIKKFPLSKEARQRLALRKRGKKYRMSFEPSYASKEEYEAEMKAKKELKKGKVDITGEKGGKKISQYVAEQRNKKNKKKKIKSLLKKGVKIGGAFFTTLLTPKKAK